MKSTVCRKGKWASYGLVKRGQSLLKDTGLECGRAVIQIQGCWMPNVYNVSKLPFHYLQNENNKAYFNRTDPKVR